MTRNEGAISLPEFVLRPERRPYRSLNPATKLLVAVVEAALPFLVGGPVTAVGVLAVVTASAAIARALRQLVVVAAVTLPLLASILVVNTFLLPGATDAIARVGPLAPTWSGLRFGVEVSLRLLAMSLALGLVYLTTEVDDLLADLERRGLGRRSVFVVGAAVQTVPALVERAGQIVDAQRARGLDTEGRFWRRARGVLPLAGPLVFGALTEVEERTIALEARAFSAPGRRALLRIPRDTVRERRFRWLLALALLLLIGVRAVAELLPA